MNPVSRFLLNLRNRVDYPLRQLFHWRRAEWNPAYRPKQGLFDHLAPDQRAQAEAQAARLMDLYHLEALEAHSTPGNYRENLFYLDMLETAFERSGAELPAERVTVADIGPSHWFYVRALHAFLRWHCQPSGREVRLSGYEVDAYRVYADLYSRMDHALGYSRGLAGVEYIPAGFQTHPGAYDLVTMFFPFVFPKDHLEWGLPQNLFYPRKLIRDAWESLKPGGVLLIVNQGEEEHRAETESLEALEIPVRAAFRQPDLLYRYAYDRYLLVAIRGN